MNPLAILWLWRLGGVVVMLGGLTASYFGWRTHERNIGRAEVTEIYNTALTKQKTEAKAVLATALEDNAAAALEFSRFKTLLEKDREISQARNDADLRARRAGPRLQFTTQATGCGPSGAAAKAGAPGPTSDAGTTVVQLPEPINGDILELAADAQSLAIDYRILYTFVHNPKLVCELRL